MFTDALCYFESLSVVTSVCITWLAHVSCVTLRFGRDFLLMYEQTLFASARLNVKPVVVFAGRILNLSCASAQRLSVVMLLWTVRSSQPAYTSCCRGTMLPAGISLVVELLVRKS